MSDQPTPAPAAPPRPAAAPPGRAHIAPASTRGMDVLPILYLVGFVILAGALAWLWRHPSFTGAAQETRVNTLDSQVAANRAAADELGRRLSALEGRPAPVATDLSPLDRRVAAVENRPAPAAPDLKPLADRIAALENRPAPAPVDLKPLQDRLAALENKPAPPPVDLRPLEGRVAELGRTQATAAAAGVAGAEAADKRAATLDTRLGELDRRQATAAEAADKRTASLDARLGAAEAEARRAAAGLTAITERAQRLGRLQAVAVALAAGQPLGDLPGAPPALARFARQGPPTESTLRASFDTAALAAQKASQPVTDDKGLGERMWLRAQQSLTVRQGDKVIVGDPVTGVLAGARQKLDAGDVAGAIGALDVLGGPARAAVADWVAQAQSLLDARAAVAAMASAQG